MTNNFVCLAVYKQLLYKVYSIKDASTVRDVRVVQKAAKSSNVTKIHITFECPLAKTLYPHQETNTVIPVQVFTVPTILRWHSYLPSGSTVLVIPTYNR